MGRRDLFIKILLCAVLLIFGSALIVAAEPIEQRNLAAGILVPGSTSPDGKFCLLDVNVGDTTAKRVIIATTDRRKNLGETDIASESSFPRMQKDRVSILWASDSKRVAIHDARARHSVVAIHRSVGKQFQLLKTQDLLAAS